MRITYFGHSAWGLEVDGHRVLVDPYALSDDAADRLRAYADDRLQAILVSHGAPDHVGLTLELASAVPGARIVTEPAVVHDLGLRGVDPDRITVLAWNGEHEEADWHVRAVEVRHVSAFVGADGSWLTGVPLGFVVVHRAEPDVRVIHMGDTSLFSDMAMLGQLYDPMIAMVGVGAAKRFFREMSPTEAALAALWLGVEVALPMHFETNVDDGRAFVAAVEHLPRPIKTWLPDVGDVFTVTRTTQMGREPSQEGPR